MPFLESHLGWFSVGGLLSSESVFASLRLSKSLVARVMSGDVCQNGSAILAPDSDRGPWKISNFPLLLSPFLFVAIAESSADAMASSIETVESIAVFV